mgnify:CR=1 FL=1
MKRPNTIMFFVFFTILILMIIKLDIEHKKNIPLDNEVEVSLDTTEIKIKDWADNSNIDMNKKAYYDILFEDEKAYK